MARGTKSPERREAERRVERRREDVIAAARALAHGRESKQADVRTLARDLDAAVADLEKAERELAELVEREDARALAAFGEAVRARASARTELDDDETPEVAS